jgi:hypothetical protein
MQRPRSFRSVVPYEKTARVPFGTRAAHWWAGQDLNLRIAFASRIYSPVPLTTRPPTHGGDPLRYAPPESRSYRFEPALERGPRGRAVPDEEKTERADVAQWLEHLPCKQRVVGSIPTVGSASFSRVEASFLVK